ncbi:putative chitobiose transport system permease protein [Chromobacterium alkanivorans]|uniref:carbohydrate ABC transporter permease n=1 Tax=Chromobacterium alkanivorans TaxID=1071719 RepID=UPI0019672146|nr:sugar ABC transporter permease [Chromobacterium alkanivorans]MBN3004803.1 sugar ABC transporter permease [Chromobacterium alkanivorans]MCS3803101.1 putative chitobiose transport system permease protein [Chromobacterium alkanivorans]MCS3817789.1 putative chitobiose transport system permease protein [Chromobacterium alkanivorans]MCS3872467.1 putative chitobiose transport system permease protein [Chromobacterium alkanivorans]
MRTKTTLQAYLFLAPALLLMLAFSFWPVGFGSFIAFTQYNLIDSPRWVGLDNFRELFADDLFLASLKNSAVYLLVVPVIQVIAMLLAVLVNNQLPAIKWFRAAYYLPVVTSVSVIGIIWNFMYTEDGVLNAALHWLRLINEPVGWLNDDRIALFAVMFITVWRGLGWYMVLYLAGLQAVPADIYEAAQLDGANAWQRFWRITVPLLAPTILLCSVMSVLAAVKAFEEVQIMTKGGPMQSTYTALFYAYEFGIKSLNFGRALAASLVMSVFCVALAWLNFRYLQPRES